MSHTPHELSEVFADRSEALQRLKADDAHFARLADRYHELNRAIHRAETDAHPISDAALEDMKKERLGLLDDLRHRLVSADG